MTEAVEDLAETVSVVSACEAIGVPRRTFYRARAGDSAAAGREPPSDEPHLPRALSDEERERMLTLLNSKKFRDKAPRQIYGELLDDGEYICHWRTMYRLLEAEGQTTERRQRERRQAPARPMLVARRPNQIWSWDITKLLGPRRWTYYYLYVILDIFSRYVVGWMVADRERATLAEKLIRQSSEKQQISPGQLVLHSDRGSAMKAKTVAQTMAELGITKSHSRPYTPDDNPYSESQFKTIKYHPEFPKRFSELKHSQRCCRDLFDWYNNEHRHSALGLMTPQDVHYGWVEQVRARRQAVLDEAWAKHPERFIGGRPTAPEGPEEVWINRPSNPDEHDVEIGAEPTSNGRSGPDAELGSAKSNGHADAVSDDGQTLLVIRQATRTDEKPL